MARWYSILFEPLGGSVYRWQGEFSPQFRGPQAYAESRPLPLPSTVAGALAGIGASISGQRGCNGDPYQPTREALEGLLGEGFRLRGPYLYIKGRRSGGEGGRARAVCAPYGASSLYCIDADEPWRTLTLEPLALQYTGIAIDTLSKTVIEHYIYTLRGVDLHATANRLARGRLRLDSLEAYGVLVEVYGSDARDSLEGKIVWMGGRQRPYRLHVLDDTPARDLAGKAPSQVIAHIVSPTLFCGDERITLSISEPRLERRLYQSFCQRLRIDCSEVCGRITFTALGLGYDLCRGRKRPYCQAVMPGAQFKADFGVPPRAFYEEGAGSHRDLGWGTLLPLPPEAWACRGDDS